jgi:hypothetical protein
MDCNHTFHWFQWAFAGSSEEDVTVFYAYIEWKICKMWSMYIQYHLQTSTWIFNDCIQCFFSDALHINC